MPAEKISKKHQCVADGVFFAELDEVFVYFDKEVIFQFLHRELAECGYSGVSVRKSTLKTEIIIRAPRPQEIIGENSRRINELTALVQKRQKMLLFNSVDLVSMRIMLFSMLNVQLNVLFVLKLKLKLANISYLLVFLSVVLLMLLFVVLLKLVLRVVKLLSLVSFVNNVLTP